MMPKVKLLNKKKQLLLKRSPKRRSFSSSSKRQRPMKEPTLIPKERKDQRLPKVQLRFKKSSINSSPQTLMVGCLSIFQEILHRLSFWRAPLPDIRLRVILTSPWTSRTSKYGPSSLNHPTIMMTKQEVQFKHNPHFSMECLFCKPPRKNVREELPIGRLIQQPTLFIMLRMIQLLKEMRSSRSVSPITTEILLPRKTWRPNWTQTISLSMKMNQSYKLLAKDLVCLMLKLEKDCRLAARLKSRKRQTKMRFLKKSTLTSPTWFLSSR